MEATCLRLPPKNRAKNKPDLYSFKPIFLYLANTFPYRIMSKNVSANQDIFPCPKGLGWWNIPILIYSLHYPRKNNKERMQQLFSQQFTATDAVHSHICIKQMQDRSIVVDV